MKLTTYVIYIPHDGIVDNFVNSDNSDNSDNSERSDNFRKLNENNNSQLENKTFRLLDVNLLPVDDINTASERHARNPATLKIVHTLAHGAFNKSWAYACGIKQTVVEINVDGTTCHTYGNVEALVLVVDVTVLRVEAHHDGNPHQ